MKSLITQLLFLFSLQIAWAQSPDNAFRSIDELLNSKVKDLEPGLAVGVVRNGEIVYEKYLGYASLQHQAPIDARSRFNIASLAKQFTALCVLNLVLEKKLSLDEDIRKYLPDFFPGIKDAIQIRHLLNHSSGIRDYYDLMSIQGNPWWRREGLSNEDALDLLARQRELNFEPGSAHLYSNSNYTLLAKVVETAAGEPFANYAKKLFLHLGMAQTDFLQNYMYVIPFQALPYSDWGNGIWQQYPLMTNLYGDGFLYTTLKDQLIYEQAVQQAQGLDNSLPGISQGPIPGAAIQHYGFGLEIGPINGYPAVHHSGGTGSYTSQSIRFPKEKLAVVVMSNNGKIWSGGLAREIAALLLKPQTDPQTAFAIPEEDVQPPVAVDVLRGAYRSADGEIIRISQQEGSLFWQVGNNNPRRLIRDSGNLFHWDINEKFKVCFSIEQGVIARLTTYYAQSGPKSSEYLPPFQPSPEYLNSLEGEYYSEELDLSFHLRLNEKKELVFQLNSSGRKSTAEMLQQDELLLPNYRLNVERDAGKAIKALLLNYDRAKKVRFTRK